MSVIATQALTKHYGAVQALEGLTIDVGPGVTGLVGANGAGKSTLIKLLLGLLEPTSGRASVLDLPVASEGARIRGLVGYMPENDCLPPDVLATEFVVHMARVSGLPGTQARERAADVLRHVGLYEERYRAIGGFSAGMKQRVKLALALVHDPRLVLLDEPTNGLDPVGRDDMLALIRRIGTTFGISVLVTSHLLGELEQIADHVVIIDSGRLLRSSSTSDFLRATGHLLVEVAEPPAGVPVDGSRAAGAAGATGATGATGAASAANVAGVGGPSGQDRLGQALAAAGLSVRPQGHLLEVRIDGDATYDTVRDETARLGLGMVRMQQSRGHLADVFAGESGPAETLGAAPPPAGSSPPTGVPGPGVPGSGVPGPGVPGPGVPGGSVDGNRQGGGPS